MKKCHYTLYFVLGFVMCSVLGFSSLHTTQNELALLCDKFNEDFTLPDSRRCVNGITKSHDTFTFINHQDNIMEYEYIRIDPTKRIEPKTRVWFDFVSFRSAMGCPQPTTFDKWRMVVWLTKEEKICYNSESLSRS